MKEQLNELALFAGAGGGILGGKLLGWRTVCAVEWDAYARDVLVARQNDGCLEAFPIWDDVQTFDGRPWQGRVDVVSGGFPCQDISCAGKGAGIDGERSGMWKHMARIIGEVRPKCAFVENSPMLVGRGLGAVLADLAEMGYDAKWGIVGAHHVSAPHKRDRIWILATDSNLRRCNDGRNPERQHKIDNAQIGATEKDQQSGSIWKHRTSENGCDVADTEGARTGNDSENNGTRSGEIHASDNSGSTSGRDDRPRNGEAMANTTGSQDHAKRGDCECGRHGMGRTEQAAQQDHGAPDHHRPCGCREICHAASSGLPYGVERSMGEPGAEPESERSDWWTTEPDVGRVAHGVAARVDRLRCIGNGQVPAVAQLAWQILTNKQHENNI